MSDLNPVYPQDSIVGDPAVYVKDQDTQSEIEVFGPYGQDFLVFLYGHTGPRTAAWVTLSALSELADGITALAAEGGSRV